MHQASKFPIKAVLGVGANNEQKFEKKIEVCAGFDEYAFVLVYNAHGPLYVMPVHSLISLSIAHHPEPSLHCAFSCGMQYVCRKTLADSRPRVRGRFARNDDPTDEVSQSLSSWEDCMDKEVESGVSISATSSVKVYRILYSVVNDRLECLLASLLRYSPTTKVQDVEVYCCFSEIYCKLTARARPNTLCQSETFSEPFFCSVTGCIGQVICDVLCFSAEHGGGGRRG